MTSFLRLRHSKSEGSAASRAEGEGEALEGRERGEALVGRGEEGLGAVVVSKGRSAAGRGMWVVSKGRSIATGAGVGFVEGEGWRGGWVVACCCASATV